MSDDGNAVGPTPHTREVHLQEVMQLPGGYKVYAFAPEQVTVIEQMIDDRIWWEGTWKRSRRVSIIAGFIAAALMGLSAWWPWVTRIMQLILPDVPRQS